jgi:N-methylhydantoinase A/oxoprolinase/acetone carboxylase beta subunit
MRGAAFLSGIKDAIVIDVGGTTTDVGALHGGFPREAGAAVEVGGVRTNFRMPDVFSIGLGGGSLVTGDEASSVTVGPRSVGYRLPQEGLVFGGSTLTATDVAVSAGRADIGERANVGHLSEPFVDAALGTIAQMTERAVERMRLTPEPIPVIVVGGGSILIPDQIGELSVLRPDHYPVANAVGAAIAQISGEVDRVFSLAELPRDEAVAQAKAEAIERAIAAGADQDTTKVVDVDDVPLAYLPGNATRIRVKAVGDLGGA